MTNNKQQTAVEWLVQNLHLHNDVYFVTKDKRKSIEQAKEMEKDRMIGLLKWMNKIASENPMRLETDDDDIVQQYYNETYGGGEQ